MRKRGESDAPAPDSAPRARAPEPAERGASRLDLTRTSALGEIRRRSPWILFALVAAVAMIAMGRNFEAQLVRRIELTYFIPVVVYLSDCIGTETLTLFVRELASHRLKLRRLFVREVAVGLALGLLAGVPMGVVAWLWLGDAGLALTVGIAMTANGLVAVLMGMIIPVLFARLKRDPAIGTDEITTALSDGISLLIYLLTASLILFW
jgi:magnesium transporter